MLAALTALLMALCFIQAIRDAANGEIGWAVVMGVLGLANFWVLLDVY